MSDLPDRITVAVRTFWAARDKQIAAQRAEGRRDAGLRGAVTGGKQMDGFLTLAVDLLEAVGVPESWIRAGSETELPGFYRPTKEWDLLVVSRGQLLAALEVKSQVGPSFGNNFNNRTEEALGSAVDLWTAFREGAFGASVQPWLGYLFLLEDSTRSQSPVAVKEPHFHVFPEFQRASYAKRYELLCRKLVLERQYTAAAFLMTSREEASAGGYTEPARDISVARLVKSMVWAVREHLE